MMILPGVQTLNRMSAKRPDKDWVAAQQTRTDARYLIMIEQAPAIVSNDARTTAALRWFTRADIETLDLVREHAIFLGADASGVPHFALNIMEHRARVVPGGPFCLKPWVDLRSLALQGQVSMDELALIGEAKAIAAWHTTARCCGHCGGSTDIKDGGWRRKCWSCGQQHFPRADPAVIMLVSHGERCILAHEPGFPDKVYSTLAGFVEPGENIEDAVRREVKEEVGVDIGTVTYLSSQPWPFPHSLMIGCLAEALTTDLVIDPAEIDDARWFTRAEMQQMLDAAHPDGIVAPTSFSIANKLVRHFVGSG